MFLLQGVALILVCMALFGSPIAASAWEVRRGGNGLRSGMICGTVVWVQFSFFGLLLEFFRHPRASVTRDGLDWFVIALPASAVGGAVIGLLEGIAFYFIRVLTRLPGTIRTRAERSARSNLSGSLPLDGSYKYPSQCDKGLQ
jgi:hypothetical protein